MRCPTWAVAVFVAMAGIVCGTGVWAEPECGVGLAGFSATPCAGVAPLEVQFLSPSPRLGVELLWQFGDGAVSVEPDPTHIYTLPGSYTVLALRGGDVQWRGHVEVASPRGRTPGIFYVTDYGARGDGATDDTNAFQAALDAAAVNGGAVLVPPVGGGRGYVLTHTVAVPQGVALIGSLAGFTNNGWSAYGLPESHVTGAKIYARPSQLGKPLFQLDGGATVKGFWILYDEQPWPSDEEFRGSASPFHYSSFEEARERFIAEHVKPYGPTFYLTFGDNTCIEDIVADRYYDFLYLKGGARVSVSRISAYGYGRAFVIEQSADVNFLGNIRIAPNGGPVCPGTACYRWGAAGCAEERTYSWIYGIIVSWPGNVGVQIGYSDGFDFEGLYFYAVHTGFRFGASKDWPIYDPVAGTVFDSPDVGQGPWGTMSDIGIDGCAVGLQFVRPGGVAMRISNLLIYPFFDDRRSFIAEAGTGDLSTVAREAALVFEETYIPANVFGHLPVVMIANAEIATYWPNAGLFSEAWVSLPDANGRVFLVSGGAAVEISGLVLNLAVDDPDPYLIAAAAGANDVTIRIRGYSVKGELRPDLTLTEGGPEP